jgi:transposase-like protein
MDGDSRKSVSEESPEFGPDTLEREIRKRVREIIGTVIEEELEAALGARTSQRTASRCGYRHGVRERTLVTSLGPTTLAVPRARIDDESGERHEWHSAMLPRYQRRSRRVDEAILGVYLSGGNSRRIKGALAPLLRGAPLGKDAVSRLVARLGEEFRTWQARDLATLQIVYTWHDGWYPKVRIGKQRVRVPVLVSMGATAAGERVLLDMRLAGQETAAAWSEVIAHLVARRIGVPALAIIDGNPGLHAALREHWPQLRIQRCTVHKLTNLLAKAPHALHEELTEDYRRMIYAATPGEVERARKAFVRKWRPRCTAVVTSFEEAGDELFTFLQFPATQWKALRTTNALERINQEFRRRTKTQASLPSEMAVLLLLYGLLRSGQIRSRRIDGWQELPKWRASSVVREIEKEAA